MSRVRVELDEADRILIKLVEDAMRAGVGRTFQAHEGERVRVQAIDEEWVELGFGPLFVNRVSLPRKIREIATKAAMLEGRIRAD